MRVEAFCELLPVALLWKGQTWYLISCARILVHVTLIYILFMKYQIGGSRGAFFQTRLISDFIILTNWSVLTKRPFLTRSRVGVRACVCCHISGHPSPIRPTMKFSGWTWCGSQPPLSLLHWAGAQKPPVLQRRSIEIEPVSVDHWPSLRSLFMPRPSLAPSPPGSHQLLKSGMTRNNEGLIHERGDNPPPPHQWLASRTKVARGWRALALSHNCIM